VKPPAIEGLEDFLPRSCWLSRGLHFAIVTRPDRNSVLLARTERSHSCSLPQSLLPLCSAHSSACGQRK